jgi:hypothetical protein
MSAAVQTDAHGGAIRPLDNLTAEIRVRWKKDADNRVTLGCLLAEAKRRVEDGEWVHPITAAPGDWRTYQVVALQLDCRSDRDIRRLLAIGNSGDPYAKAEADRARAREGMAAVRAGRTNKADVSPAVTANSEELVECGPEDVTEYDIWKTLTRFNRGMFLRHVAETSPTLYRENAPPPVAGGAAEGTGEPTAGPMSVNQIKAAINQLDERNQRVLHIWLGKLVEKDAPQQGAAAPPVHVAEPTPIAEPQPAKAAPAPPPAAGTPCNNPASKESVETCHYVNCHKAGACAYKIMYGGRR